MTRAAILVLICGLAIGRPAGAQIRVLTTTPNGGHQPGGGISWGGHGGNRNGGNSEAQAAAFWWLVGQAIQHEFNKNQHGQGGQYRGGQYGGGQNGSYPGGGYQQRYFPQQQPQPKPQPRPQPSPAPPTPTVPVATTTAQTPVQNVIPPATRPRPNELRLVGRSLTRAQIDQARNYYRRRQAELTAAIGQQIPLIEVDRAELLKLLIGHAVAAEIQIRILDALRAANLDEATRLWTAHCPGTPVAFRRSRFCTRLDGFFAKLEAGSCTARDAEELEREMLALGLAEHPCCGAPSLLEEVRECTRFGQVFGDAQPGDQTQATIVPAGDVDIILNPTLDEGSTLVLDDQTVMLGTGGIGTLQLQHGNVAQRQGYPLGTGTSLEDSAASLVTTGILIENPNATAVNFVMANQRVSLPPSGRQAFGAPPMQISFDAGNGRGTQHFRLEKPGTLQFAFRDRAWALDRIGSFHAVIDNRASDAPFHYIVQGEHAVAAAGTMQSHTSTYPLVFRFDRGNGTATKQVVSSRPQATLTVGINPSDNLWDLFGPAAGPAVRPALAGSNGSSAAPLFPEF